MMQMRTLGTDLNVSAVGLGCMGFSHAYGAPTEEASSVFNDRVYGGIRQRRHRDRPERIARGELVSL